MSHPIPEPFKWDKSFETFYQQIDDEHKGLFNGIFDCCNDRASADKLATLYGLCEKHFTDEEGIMQKANYADLASHKGLHAEFLGKLKGLSTPLTDDNVHFAKNWLVQHIKTIDFKYKGKL